MFDYIKGLILMFIICFIYHEPICLHGYNSLTSNTPLVTYLSKHQTFMHLIIVNMVLIYKIFDTMVY
jgi:hypothetical protein